MQKVDSKKNHKNRCDNLTVGAVASHTVIDDTKSTSTGCTKRNTQGIEQRNSANQKKNNLEQCHSNINRVKNFGGLLNFWNQFADGRTRAFGFHQIHMIPAGKW